MKFTPPTWPAALGLAALIAGCGGSSSGPTYWSDVAPLLNDKCVKCHQPGGIGPFSMLDYDQVASRTAKIAALTQARTMPPFLITHDGSCGQFEDSDALTQGQIDTLGDWAAGKMEVGTKVTLTPPRPPALEGGREFQTPTITPVAAGTPLALYDEYRCFPMDTGLTRDQFITAHEVLPGRPELVHHLIGYLVDPDKRTRGGKTNGEILAALDASDPDRVGWPCFGGAGDGVEEDSSPILWAPGTGPVIYPDDLGVKQRPTDKLIIQIHYNLADEKNRGLSDSTTVRIRYADSVTREAFFITPDGFLETLFTKKQPDVLLPGMPSVSYTWKKTMAEMGFGMAPPVEVIAVGPHMHQRGRRSELRFSTGGPADADQCMAKVQDWNFHWQRPYYYKTPRPLLTRDSQIQLTCEYDTSADERPVLPGWGTRNEMCLDSLMVAPRM